MSLVVSPTLEAVYTKVRALIVFIVPTGTEVVRGLDNRVPTPAGPYVMFQNIMQRRLATNIAAYDDSLAPDPGTRSLEQKTEIGLQVDFYGDSAEEWATIFSTIWRDEVGCAMLSPECQPLHADDARQIEDVTGEEQYLQRWCVTAYLQWNPVTSTSQEFTGTLSADLVNVDVTYPEPP